MKCNKMLHLGKLMLIAVLLVAVPLSFLACSSGAPSAKGESVTFEDPKFGQLIKDFLGKDEITTTDLSQITGIQLFADQFIFLTGPDSPAVSVVLFGEDTFEYEGTKYTGFGTMESLADLKSFPMLNTIDIALQPAIDYYTIPNLDRLTNVMISMSKLEDIGFLSGAVNLINLALDGNKVSNISPVSSMQKLKYLFLHYNNVSDISPLEGLPSLKRVGFYGNSISDISVFASLPALEQVEMYDNKISDLSPLKNIKTLKKVELINNQITDVSPLKDFDSFEELRLTGNPITNIDVLSHIANLEFEQ